MTEESPPSKFHPAFSRYAESIMGAFDRDLIYWHEARRNLGHIGLTLDQRADLPNFEPPTPAEDYEPDWSDEADLADVAYTEEDE